MHFLQKSKKKENKEINASKEKRKIKDSHIRYTRDIKEKMQLNSVKTMSLNAGEYVRSLRTFSRMNISIL